MKQKRIEKGYTQEEMANKLYIAKSTYNQYETGKRRIEVAMYQQILALLELEVTVEKIINSNLQLHNPNPKVYDVIAYSTYQCKEDENYEVRYSPISFYLVPKTFLIWAEGEFFENSSGLFEEEIDPNQEKLTPLGIILKSKYENGRRDLNQQLTDYFNLEPCVLADYLGHSPIKLGEPISPEAYLKAKRKKLINLNQPTETFFDEQTWTDFKNEFFRFKTLDYCVHWDN